VISALLDAMSVKCKARIRWSSRRSKEQNKQK
jgi:hypothetical protein